MLKRIVPAIAAGLLCLGCAAPERITEGVYVGSNGGTLIVKRNYIDIDIPTTDKRVEPGGTRVFYEVKPNGSVGLWGSSTSSFITYVLTDWDWHWTGMEFQSKHREDGTVVIYTRQKQRPR